ncbi:Stf0 family sulfotransferase [Pseudoalteromonas sp. Z1A2]|uniref:Stf0 family sulfotransferase n=1 Tax=Pseudoalteromonas sp. Z1A2 TaxID=2686350 RepID=UPI0013FD4E6E|nr:Stf0 family sulfotransferase [Pseudoalteromonas sp. Z1A2]
METKLIILCATQRCGSTMIVEDLRNTNVMGKAEEYFIPWNPEKDVDWLKSFEAIIEKSKTDNGVSAIKVMANQLKSIEHCLSLTNLEPSKEGLFPRVKSLLSNATFIRIKRDGIVRQAISRVIATKTGVNHALHNNDSDYKPGNLLKDKNLDYNSNITYKNEEIDIEVINIARETLLWDEVLKSWGVNSPLELHYEQVCRAYPNYLTRVSNYLGIKFDLESLPKARNIKKLSNNKNEILITNYLEE